MRHRRAPCLTTTAGTVLYGLGVVLQARRKGIGLAAILWALLYVAWRRATFVLAWKWLDRISLGRPQKDVG
jgi:hypothetical protein